MAKKSPVVVLKEFFGAHPNPKPPITSDAKGFLTELKELSLDEKLSLARDAAKALGLTQDDVDFPLTV